MIMQFKHCKALFQGSEVFCNEYVLCRFVKAFLVPISIFFSQAQTKSCMAKVCLILFISISSHDGQSVTV